MPYVTTASGQCLFYVRRSGGSDSYPPILLIHGAGGNALLWGSVLHALSGVDALALDLPGHGRSAGPSCSTVADQSARVLELADALRLARLVVAGHSMGGAVALDLALRAPSRVEALVLMSTTARFSISPTVLQQLSEDPGQVRQWMIETGYGPQTLAEARHLGAKQLAQVPVAVLHNDLLACSLYDATARLPEIRCPALVLCGSEDRLTPPEHVRALQAGLMAARFELVPGAGHMLPLERPGAVAEAILRFLHSGYSA